MPREESKIASIEGVRPVIEAIRAGRRQVLEVAIPEGSGSPGLRELCALAQAKRIPVRPGASGSGVVARAEAFPEEPFEALLADGGPVFLVALDGVTDVGNLGSIARSAEAAGASGIVLEERRSPPIGPGACRASAGAIEHLRIGRTPRLARALELALAEGLAVLVAEADGEPMDRVDPALLRGGLIWVLGSEDRGTRPNIQALASLRVRIPLHGRVASLGVAAAAAHLLLWTAEVRSR